LLTTINNSYNPTAEGGAAYNISKVSNESKAETTNFVDGDTPWSYDITATPDETSQLAGFSDAELGDFLSRPIKIKEYQWTPASALSVTRFNPWQEFFGNADVLDKINRYRNLRCNLRLKVLVNGNGFYYGRALMSYNPYVQDDEVTVNRAFIEEDLVQASQKPHLLLDPTSSQGGEMLLPFIWPENYLDITKAGWEANMGEIDIHDFDVLQHANGGTDPITVTIFCWAENVTLSVPTTAAAQAEEAPAPPSTPELPQVTTELKLLRYKQRLEDAIAETLAHHKRKEVPKLKKYNEQGAVTDADLDEFGFPLTYVEQAKSKQKKETLKANNTSSNDEFRVNGLISKPASAVAKAADALSMIPMLAPYAKATSLVATKVGNVARILGYSRPQVMEDTRSYVPRFMGNMANSDAPEPIVKLSLDSKNELSVDTRVMGLGGEDELMVNSIAKRWSYFRQFDWPETAVTDTMLTSMNVSPLFARVVTSAPVQEIHSTALTFAATPFEAWQGSIKFRFNVVCSEYHRGRLRIVYNPATSPAGAIPFNQTYSTVIDISENRDFEYEVKWADIRAWGLNAGLGAAPSSTIYDDVNPVTTGGLYDNGSISVYVVNELATPSTTAADVKIQVWVAAGDDFAVAVPTTKNISLISYHAQQSEEAPYVAQADEAPGEALASAQDTSNSPGCVAEIASFAPGEHIKEDNQYLVYQGERIVSLRELLRRYNYHNCYFPGGEGTTTANRAIAFNIHDFPFYRGWETNGQDTATNSVPATAGYNFCSTTMLNYLTPAFACRRGGLRHKVLASQLGSASRAVTMSAARHNIIGKANSVDEHLLTGVVGDCRSQMLDKMSSGLGGTHITNTYVNPCLEYETPFYTNGQRFLPARKINLYDQVEMAHEVCIDVPDNTPSKDYRIDKFVSVAEDFQLGLFVGAPIAYYYGDPVAVT
jgi:hypothetical protein